jgi:hypothetical protein
MKYTTYTNAPKRLKSAIERLAEAERVLEDLARAVEIASVTGQINLTDVYRSAAEEYLKDKLAIDYQDTSDMKLKIYTDSNA